MKLGYQQTEVGVIPEDWKVKEVRQLCTLINGRGFKPNEWDTRGLPIIRIQNLNGSEEFNFFSGSFNQKIQVEPGQLLFAWSGSRGTSFGPHIWKGETAVLNYHTWKVVVKDDEVDPDFYFHALKNLTKSIEDQAHGASALVHTQKWEMEGFKVPVASDHAEQRAIAAALADVDAAVAGLERLIAKKRDVKQAVMQQLLTGQTRLPGFSGEWEVRRLGDSVTFLRNGTLSRAQLTTDDPVCYLHYGDIHGSTGVFLSPSTVSMPTVPDTLVSRLDRLQDGDLVFADASEDLEGVGKSVEIQRTDGRELVSGLHTIAARFDKDVLADSFKAYLQFVPAFSAHLKKHAAGTKVLATNRSHIATVELELPAPDEQKAIAGVFNDMDVELSALEAQLDKTRLIKQAMMQELLTGRTRLPFQ